MNLYKLLKDLIEANYYEKKDMSNKLNVFYTFNQISLEEYTELMSKVGQKPDNKAETAEITSSKTEETKEEKATEAVTQ